MQFLLEFLQTWIQVHVNINCYLLYSQMSAVLSAPSSFWLRAVTCSFFMVSSKFGQDYQKYIALAKTNAHHCMWIKLLYSPLVLFTKMQQIRAEALLYLITFNPIYWNVEKFWFCIASTMDSKSLWLYLWIIFFIILSKLQIKINPRTNPNIYNDSMI